MRKPAGEFVTAGQIARCGAGVSLLTIRKAVATGVLVPRRWPGCKWRRFWWADVVRVFGIGMPEDGEG